MAIAFDATSNGGTTTYGTSNTFSHTCTGSDLVLFVIVARNNSDISGVTYNGTALTKLFTNSSSNRINVWWMPNPPTGAHNVVISGGDGTTYKEAIIGQAISYTGCDPKQPDSYSSESDTTTSPKTQNTTVGVSNCWLIGTAFAAQGVNTPSSITSDKTSRQAQDWAVNYGGLFERQCSLVDTNGTVSTGTQGITFTRGSTNLTFDTLVFSIYRKGDAPASGPANVKTYKGLVSSSVKSLKGLAIASCKSKKGLA